MDISVDLSVLLYPSQWKSIIEKLPVRVSGVDIENIAVEQLYSACEKENILVNDYWLRYGQAPTGAEIYRIIVNGSSTLPLNKCAAAVAEAFPAETIWYGTAEIGHTEFGLGTTLAWTKSP